ncbi:MAG: hypothetical protein D6B28_11660 [Gammaproteobacteria bacterium]|nr:MAG: hypothetical protein D6B28_11660 [Gammaproteobacteria bacterium]
MIYELSILEANGAVKKISVTASSQAEAIEKSGYSEDRVVSARRDAFARIKGLINNRSPDLDTQAVFLQVLAGLLSSGRPAIEAVHSLMKSMGNKVNVNKVDLSDQLEVSKILEALKFDQSAIVLAQVGEESGRLADLLGMAAQNIMKRISAGSEMRKGMAMGAVYFVVGIVMLTVFPLYIVPQMQRLINHPKSNFTSNQVTEILLSLYDIYTTMYPVLIIALTVIFVFRNQLWLLIRTQPVISLVYDFQRTSRGLTFLQAFRPLYEAGVVTERAIQLLRDRASGEMYNIYDGMYKGIISGEDISSVLDTDDWPLVIRQGFVGFAGLDHKQRVPVIDQLLESLNLDRLAISRSIGRVLNMLGLVTILTGIYLVAQGFYIPIMSMSIGSL